MLSSLISSLVGNILTKSITKKSRHILTSVAVGKFVISSDVIPNTEQKMAPIVSLAQSDEKVMQVDTIANIDASMQSGITYVIYMVIGTTARHVNVALSTNMRNAFKCQSDMDHHLRFAPEDSTLTFHLIKLAYIKQVCTICISKDIFINFHVCTLVK